ncbi:hypothetical protein [Actinomyces sp. HMSC08A09]|uniref:hypothetical protein n=1 Tax=Actinomyces sp. HMSC08A09 TaxID=1581133 RepID=UPI00210A593A|nr:hypothetical protein [Actinomyces sp. HMSC08A09]
MAVVDDEHAGDVVVIGEDADAYLRGACVDGVVDEVGERRGGLVMGSQGVAMDGSGGTVREETAAMSSMVTPR